MLSNFLALQTINCCKTVVVSASVSAESEVYNVYSNNKNVP